MSMFHEGSRTLQDRFDGREIADRLEENRKRDAFNEEDRAFIHALPFFFLATAHGDSVDCSFKGGEPGFVRVTSDTTLEFPDYDGNRMYRSLGNILMSPSVGLLFVQFEGKRARLRVSGTARLIDDPARVAQHHGAKLVVEVAANAIFPNCPRYIPKVEAATPSPYAPRPDYTPPQPEWKYRDYIRDILPEGEREIVATTERIILDPEA